MVSWTSKFCLDTKLEHIYFVPASANIMTLEQTGIGNLGLSFNCKWFGKSAVFQMDSIINVENSGF